MGHEDLRTEQNAACAAQFRRITRHIGTVSRQLHRNRCDQSRLS